MFEITPALYFKTSLEIPAHAVRVDGLFSLRESVEKPFGTTGTSINRRTRASVRR